MKHFIQNLILIILLTLLILFSYAFVQNKIDSFSVKEFYDFLTKDFSKVQKDGQKNGDSGKEQSYKGVWLSYLEFNCYRKSVKKNDEAAFRNFFERVLNQSKKCGFNRIIVHVRPFGDALYQSDYYPWAACISGKQGKDPGYDPLKIMTEMVHEKGMYIEAWINPYRISSGTKISDLSVNNPARKWAEDSGAKRNILSYEDALYYNPASEEVRQLICNGVKEIVENYDVDGIHMDDYFYPVFTEKNVESAFDAPEYKEEIKNGGEASQLSIAEWRRNNVSRLVSDIYKTIKTADQRVSFGISPAGNLSNLRSDLEYYADVDTWAKEEGYVDYLMPQIYWGFTNDQAPFKDVMNQWIQLTENTDTKLYLGLQLYRMGTDDKSQSDYRELQSASLITKELKQIKKESQIEGYCFFSYQYLDVDNKTYQFDSNEFAEQRKKVLKKIKKALIKLT